jgi:hypothetical protein
MLGGYIAGALLLETNIDPCITKPTRSGINVSFLGFSVCSQDIEKEWLSSFGKYPPAKF